MVSIDLEGGMENRPPKYKINTINIDRKFVRMTWRQDFIPVIVRLLLDCRKYELSRSLKPAAYRDYKCRILHLYRFGSQVSICRNVMTGITNLAAVKDFCNEIIDSNGDPYKQFVEEDDYDIDKLDVFSQTLTVLMDAVLLSLFCRFVLESHSRLFKHPFPACRSVDTNGGGCCCYCSFGSKLRIIRSLIYGQIDAQTKSRYFPDPARYVSLAEEIYDREGALVSS